VELKNIFIKSLTIDFMIVYYKISGITMVTIEMSLNSKFVYNNLLNNMPLNYKYC